MEERTFINEQDISCLYIQLVKCKIYEDAQKLLNAFVLDFIKEHGGEIYDGGFDFDEHENIVKVQYQNSKNPKNVKRAIFDALISTCDKTELLAKEVLDRCDTEIKEKDWQFVTHVRQNAKDSQNLRRWTEDWRKEPAPIIKEEKTPRLRPTEAGKKYAPLMYKHLQEIAYIDANEQSWNYLCGLTDETNDFKPIRWLKTDFLLKVLIDNFLTKETYFSVEAGAIKDTLYNSLADPEGNKIKQKSVEVAITNRQGEERRKSGEKRNPKTDEAIKNAWMNMRVNGML